MVRYPSYDSTTCGTEARVFDLRGRRTVTEENCKSHCIAETSCIAFSAKWGQWCIGCSQEMTLTNRATPGAVAFHKEAKGKQTTTPAPTDAPTPAPTDAPTPAPTKAPTP